MNEGHHWPLDAPGSHFLQTQRTYGWADGRTEGNNHYRCDAESKNSKVVSRGKTDSKKRFSLEWCKCYSFFLDCEEEASPPMAEEQEPILARPC